MEKFVTLFMYLLWVLTIIFVLASTFTGFENEDLNIFSVVLLVFSVLNSFFILSRKR